MKRLMIAVASLALIASAATAEAKVTHKNHANGPLIQRNVSMPTGPATRGQNSDLKYGPQPDYPQSPAGGGY
jgi:hypothetical protein